jgi:hypothetical protein
LIKRRELVIRKVPRKRINLIGSIFLLFKSIKLVIAGYKITGIQVVLIPIAQKARKI